MSRTEPDMGVGLITSSKNQNQIQVYFPQAEEARIYINQANSPLQRYALNPGEKAWLPDGSFFVIEEIVEENHLLCYRGKAKECWEWELGGQVEDQGTFDQFIGGQFSHHHTFDLRKEAWAIRGQSLSSQVGGMVGPRVTPLPHQLFIARTVAQQNNPRVLLADEVGLGKTIEAGLIFSSMRALDRAKKVLILVPDSLKHQWLAEMFRRFNELFTVLDEDRCLEEESSQTSSPFEANQKILCSIDFLSKEPLRREQALAIDWDLIIIDEAHHFLLNQNNEECNSWAIIQKLSSQTRGLLMLTATPSMYGLDSQFNLLQLIDPNRFNNFDEFQKEIKTMQAVATIAKTILNNENLVLESIKNDLQALFPEDQNLLSLFGDGAFNRQKALQALVDRHGTGRVFYRNRRKRLKGFPKRNLFSVPLASDKNKRHLWLKDFLTKHIDEKILIICSSQTQVLRLKKFLQEDSNIKPAVFHEGLSIVERDIQAARFAESTGAQVLICSEIGGEGRNFQFCHKLVLFDLPSHPDLVEQRIGRLDRIGQSSDIEIYVPWTKQSAEEVLFRWYHEGLNAFEEAWNGAGVIFDAYKNILDVLANKMEGDSTNEEVYNDLEKLIHQTQKDVDLLLKKNEESIDVLVDLNSYNENIGKQLVNRVEDCDDNPALELFMRGLFDHFGIEYNDFDDKGSIIIKGESLKFIQDFPGIKLDEDAIFTFDRKTALEREDFIFLSQDHNITEEALSFLLDRNQGVASVCKWPDSPHSQGALIEASILLVPQGPKHLELERYLPLDIHNFIVDHNNKRIVDSPHLEHPHYLRELNASEHPGDGARLKDFMTPIIDNLLTESEKWAQKKINQAIKKAKEDLSSEGERLKYLANVNPNVSDTDLVLFQERANEILKHLANTKPRLDAIRLIFT